MLDEPNNDLLKNSYRVDLLAGEKYEADQQCKLNFGPDSSVCTYMVS